MPPKLAQVPPQVLANYLKQVNIATVQCMLCGTVGKYVINPVVYDIKPVIEGGGMVIGAGIPTIPVILIICKQCGNIRFISTVITQLTPQVMISNQPPPPPSDEPSGGR